MSGADVPGCPALCLGYENDEAFVQVCTLGENHTEPHGWRRDAETSEVGEYERDFIVEQMAEYRSQTSPSAATQASPATEGDA